MDSYLQVVKALGSEHKSGNVSSFSFFEKTDLVWPSFLNYVLDQGVDLWKLHINAKNYMFTAQLFVQSRYDEYRDWLLERDFVNAKAVIHKLAMHSSSDEFIDRYPDLYLEYKLDIIDFALYNDNHIVFSSVAKKENFTSEKLVEYMVIAMQTNSEQCFWHIEEMIHHQDPVPLDTSIWVLGMITSDISVVRAILGYLVITPSLDEVESCKGIKSLVLGSVAEVEETLKDSCNESMKIFLLSVVASRIPEDEAFSFILEKKCKDWSFTRENGMIAKLASEILESGRSAELTGKIILSLNKRGIVFTKNDFLHFASFSEQSWIAILENKILFDFSNFKITPDEDNYKLNPDMFRPRQRKVLKNVLKTICPELESDTNTTLFMELGSSLSKWGYDMGLLKELHGPLTCFKLAAEKANLFMLALALNQLENMRVPIGIEYLSPFKFHVESVTFLNLWLRCKSDQKEIFCKYGFSCHFYDTSLYVNVKEYNGDTNNNVPFVDFGDDIC